MEGSKIVLCGVGMCGVIMVGGGDMGWCVGL